MKLFYLKMGKEEIANAMHLLSNLNDDSVNKIFTHLSRSMDFIVDFLNNERSQDSDILSSKNLIEKVVGKEFIETYFLLSSLKSKSVSVLNSSNIILRGKSVSRFEKSNLTELIKTVVEYFNTVYEKTEKGLVWL